MASLAGHERPILVSVSYLATSASFSKHYNTRLLSLACTVDKPSWLKAIFHPRAVQLGYNTSLSIWVSEHPHLHHPSQNKRCQSIHTCVVLSTTNQ
ncbi:uncharacterized protein ASPGLDRAFT_748209 [Aspergillus glaucus CBS 516.65]|uniref:Uncharacterized protein n=1 Tax=Aspergillus glaucus CBS 516.65 TaxID=1160497 RepID=A0A1L9VY55_ASPGL|nr:hypothetical protein ASPGLDRAFT_748209 [Aspergillus glaucus CBS 516.65]OJJ88836.1 hypothetical protein ASPGLDRAFT_748209 [Aspergillus glaucus CBS 516.65]